MQPARRFASLALLACLLASQDLRAAPAAAGIHFPVSCPAVQAEFDRAVTLLHSFEYPETGRLFRRILDRDPGCAMAHWGLAMSLWHPLWAPPSAAELAQGAAILRGVEAVRVTPREALWIAAARAFFADTDPAHHLARAAAYSRHMEALYAEDRDDTEAALFYALSLLAIADPRDKSYLNQYQAAAVLNHVRELQPLHPGVLHYLIHAFDYPGLAYLALGAATLYADAAPDSAHAQHMPAHIFTRLGLWERAIASNHRATAAAADYTVHAHLPGHYDEGFHSIDYEIYALLQTARDEEARRLLRTLHDLGKADVDNFKVAYTWAAAPARYALERRAWGEASRLMLAPADFPWREFPWAESIHHFARGLGAARGGNLELARVELEKIRALAGAVDPTLPAYWREEMSVQADAVAGWVALAEDRRDEALALARAAADREDAVDKHPVTPGEVLPARELYADMLFAVGRFPDALDAYRRVLASAPHRYNAVLGAARSAARSGEPEAARAYYAELEAIAPAARPGRASLDEAAAFLAAKQSALP
ncbi:MAG TPA: tetratricopeptide repeat protein [Woeseiaceae bacterium]